MIEFEVEEWEGRGWMLHVNGFFLGFYETKPLAQAAAEWVAAHIVASAILQARSQQYLN